MHHFDIWTERLIQNEGLKLTPYRCTRGKLTIGVGRNLEDNPLTFAEKQAVGDWRKGITKNAALMLLRNDITRTLADLQEIIPNWEKLAEDRQYALLDMCFQLGLGGLLKFKRMLSYVAKENFEMAAYECLNSAYAKQTPKRAQRIARALKFATYS
jgi:lysozyme